MSTFVYKPIFTDPDCLKLQKWVMTKLSIDKNKHNHPQIINETDMYKYKVDYHYNDRDEYHPVLAIVHFE